MAWVCPRIILPHTLSSILPTPAVMKMREKPATGLPKEMTAEQIAEAQHRARAWKPKKWEELKGQLDRLR